MRILAEYNDDGARLFWEDGKYYYHFAGENKFHPIPDEKLHLWKPQLEQIKPELRKLKLEKLLKED